MFQHLLVAAGQQQPAAFHFHLLAVAVHGLALLLHGAFQAIQEGAAVGQLRQAGRGHLAVGVFLGVAAQFFQPRLMGLQRALALGQIAGDLVLVLLGAAQQGIDTL